MKLALLLSLTTFGLFAVTIEEASALIKKIDGIYQSEDLKKTLVTKNFLQLTRSLALGMAQRNSNYHTKGDAILALSEPTTTKIEAIIVANENK